MADASYKIREKQAFEKYLSTRTILIADPSAASRSGILAVFRELGANLDKVLLTNSFSLAHEQILELKPNIVVAEYDFGKHCGLDLLQRHREQHPLETKDSLFVIVTSNTSQTAVARAAEEDIDAYILKPYTADTMRKTVMRACVFKANPPVYYVIIEAGKKLLLEGKFDEAEQKFEEASILDPAPALACYYIGQVKYLRKVIGEAQGNYEQGLAFNRIHYKCMVGLYELFMSQQQHAEAYDVVKRISRYFPANPKRLAEVLRLAIVNGKYEDIERYYNTFMTIDEHDESLVRYICAALIVCGKYYLSTGVGISRATELFSKAASTGSGRTKILREIIVSLLEYGVHREAKMFLSKFPPESFNSDEFLLMRFLIASVEGKDETLLDQGRTLLAKGVSDERLYEAMIERLLKAGFTPAAETLLEEALNRFPEKRDLFERAVQRANSVSKVA